MVLEAEGRCTGDVGQRSEQDSNVWTFDTAAEPSTQESSWGVPMSPAILIDAIRTAISNQGDQALDQLIASFRAIDDRGNGVIDRQEFLWGLRDFGIALNDIESNIILNHFDTNKDGAITINEFSAALGKSSTTEGGEENSKETKK